MRRSLICISSRAKREREIKKINSLFSNSVFDFIANLHTFTVNYENLGKLSCTKKIYPEKFDFKENS